MIIYEQPTPAIFPIDYKERQTPPLSSDGRFAPIRGTILTKAADETGKDQTEPAPAP